jgi:peptidoglycan/xylan/chitin deacetylase (PgdA/CDA1 family)
LNFYEKEFAKNQVKVIMYHRVSPQNENWCLRPLQPMDFEEHIKFLKQNYTIIPLVKLKDYCIKEDIGNNKKNLVISTFDDGYKDNYLYAYPILKKHNVSATFFLTSGLIDTKDLFWWDQVGYLIYNTKEKQIKVTGLGEYTLNSEKDKLTIKSNIIAKLKRMENERKNQIIEELWNKCKLSKDRELNEHMIMSWDDIAEMKNDGFDFGAHTVDHPIMTNLALKELRRQIIDSKTTIQQKLNTRITAFAYPNGTIKDFDESIIHLLHNEGFEYAVTTVPGFNKQPSDFFKLNRVSGDGDLKMLQLKLSIFYCRLANIRIKFSDICKLQNQSS